METELAGTLRWDYVSDGSEGGVLFASVPQMCQAR